MHIALRQAVDRATARSPRETASHVSLTLSTVPPSVNGIFYNLPRGRGVTREYRAWRDGAVSELRSVQRAPLVKGKVHVDWRIARAGGDLDNRLKAGFDALVEANVIEDDRHVESFTACWDDSIKGVLIEVRGMAR